MKHSCVRTPAARAGANLRCALCAAAWTRTVFYATLASTIIVVATTTVARDQNATIRPELQDLITTIVIISVFSGSALLPLRELVIAYRRDELDAAYARREAERQIRSRLRQTAIRNGRTPPVRRQTRWVMQNST